MLYYQITSETTGVADVLNFNNEFVLAEHMTEQRQNYIGHI